MTSKNYRDDLVQHLRNDLKYAAAYFVEAVVAHDPAVLQVVLGDLLDAGYPRVEMTKVRSSLNATEPPGEWGTYLEGESNDASLPVDYSVRGLLLQGPSIGSWVIILQLVRNGVAVPGVFQSTAVKAFNGAEFETENSVFEIEHL